MTVLEERIFIDDPKRNMTREEKNKHLAYKIGGAPLCRENIIRIERVAIGAMGWWIYYRTATPE